MSNKLITGQREWYTGAETDAQRRDTDGDYRGAEPFFERITSSEVHDLFNERVPVRRGSAANVLRFRAVDT